jgi:hypothetical protein
MAERTEITAAFLITRREAMGNNNFMKGQGNEQKRL